MKTLITNADIILSHTVLSEGYLVFEDDIISDFGSMAEMPRDSFDCVIDAEGRYLSPGFVDIHVHGGGGGDFLDGEEDSFLAALRSHVRGGTTTIMPTLSAAATDSFIKSIDVYELIKKRWVEYDIPNLAGIHMEGPYCAQAQRGAQEERFVRNPDSDEYNYILNYSDSVKRWSSACELPGALEMARAMRKRGVSISIGHSDAETSEVYEAYDYGFDCITHLYSGCSMVHRKNAFRYCGVVEAAYLIDGMDVEIIADGAHLPVDLLKLIYKIKGADKIALITDSTRAGGVGGIEALQASGMNTDDEFIVESGVAIMPDRTCFYGGIATTAQLVRVMTEKAGVDIVNAVRMASLTPARIIGIDDVTGSIVKGKRADLVVFDRDVNISDVIVAGKVCG